MYGLLIIVASLVAEHLLLGAQASVVASSRTLEPEFSSCGSGA